MTGLVVDWGLRQTAARLGQAVTMAEPLSAAAHAMEINVIRTGLGVLQYLETGMPQHRARIAEIQQNFARFLAQYSDVASTPHAQELGVRAGNLYEAFRALGERLVERHDQQQTLLATLYRDIAAADNLLDAYRDSQEASASEHIHVAQYTAIRLETSLGEMGHWLGRYLQMEESHAKTQMLKKLDEIQVLLQQLVSLSLSAPERAITRDVTHYVSEIQPLLPQVFTLQEARRNDLQQFLGLRTALDALLDDELQQFPAQGLLHAILQAQDAMWLLRLIFVSLLAVGLLLGGGVWLRLRRSIGRAVHGLVEGARAIGRGTLAHRIVPVSRDELAEVAMAFNAMAAQRQQAEVALHRANATLEVHVEERTMAIAEAYKDLEQQLSARQQAERALHASEARYRALFDNANDVIYITDVRGQLLTINPAVETITGYRPSEILDRNIQEFVVLYKSEITDPMPSLPPRLPLTNYEADILSKDGRMVTLEVSSRFLRQKGEPVVIYGIARDVSERLRLEAQVRHQQRLDSLGTMASGIAHDFNNILTAILGYTDLALLDLAPDSATAEALHTVLTAGQRARHLVQQILTFSRQATSIRQPVMLHSVVQEVLHFLRVAHPPNITIEQSCARETDRVLGDETQLHQMVLNLCLNAMQAMHDTHGVLDLRQKRVVVDTEFATAHASLRPGLHLCLSISDTGHGMASGVLAHIFEPFFTTKVPGEGAGMGLAVVHGIVTSHQGAITVDSSPGQGTTFNIYLPYIEDQEDSPTPAAALAPSGQTRVLCVDDDVLLVTLWDAILTPLGYDVTTCTNSLEALRLFRGAPERYDIVVTDQNMPGLPGDALIRALHQLRPTLPIVLCTGVRHLLTPQQAQALGITVFLRKPVGEDELPDAIQRALASHRGDSEPG